ncbi:MAG TPA: NAD(P)/FAD-dependent oxidoreductase [Terriglobales bacterium]|nr:NAD(P)/FAD-dependent oxidoreductase [Terriglobales bacterium]
MQRETPKVVIVGGGFAGLNAARKLAGRPVQVTLVDRKNHHTFQPLLYQVATAGLSPGDIAAPIRRVLRHAKNTEVLLGNVTGFDLNRRQVLLKGSSLDYDYLIVAAGARHSYFGHDEWEKYAPGLKTIEDATEMRRRVLLAFEAAEREKVCCGKHEQVNIVVIGAGPTGVELAGTLAEVARKSLAEDFRNIDPTRTRILLVEAGPRVLPQYPEELSTSATKQLERLGVEVRTSTVITSVDPYGVRFGSEFMAAQVILWAAGVAASPLGRALGVPVDKKGLVVVGPDLSVPGHPELFVIGDLAAVKTEDGKQLPGLAPVAIQEGRFVAKMIVRDLNGSQRVRFHYVDKGSLATIGRAAAVGEIGKWKVSGWFAWVAWLFVHILYLVGFRNRLIVLIQWAWSYITYDRGARLITGDTERTLEAKDEEPPGALIFPSYDSGPGAHDSGPGLAAS